MIIKHIIIPFIWVEIAFQDLADTIKAIFAENIFLKILLEFKKKKGQYFKFSSKIL